VSQDKETIPLDIGHSPNRVWFITRELPDGTPLWGSREWHPGERLEYEREAMQKGKRA